MKRLIAPIDRIAIYNSKGDCIGYEVIEVDGFTEKELRDSGTLCSECGKASGHHGEYFVRTGQSGGGDVYGHYQNCSRGN